MNHGEIEDLADKAVARISGQLSNELRTAEIGEATIRLLAIIAKNTSHLPDIAYTLRNLHKEVKAEFVDAPVEAELSKFNDKTPLEQEAELSKFSGKTAEEQLTPVPPNGLKPKKGK